VVRVPKLINAAVVSANTINPSSKRPRPVMSPSSAPPPKTSSGAAWTATESRTPGVIDTRATVGRSSAGAMSDDADRLMAVSSGASKTPRGVTEQCEYQTAHAGGKCVRADELSSRARRGGRMDSDQNAGRRDRPLPAGPRRAGVRLQYRPA